MCISTQIGCTFNCKHCATAKIKFERNLTKEEIMEQIKMALDEAAYSKIDIMFYGMGEPLLNYQNVFDAADEIKKLYKDKTLNFFVSTSGVKDGIEKIPDYFNLSISLHVAIEEKREELIPQSRVYSLKPLKEDLVKYQKNNNKPITLHYCLIKNFNMDDEAKDALEEFCKDINEEVHVIPFNEFPASSFVRPSDEEAAKFVEDLCSRGINAKLKISRSRDIGGACGQLASQKK